MNFDYVWALMEVNGNPPTSNKLHRSSYKFYPFSHIGKIVTIDYSVWDLADKKEASSSVAITRFPQLDTISRFIDVATTPNIWRLVILIDSSEAITIDPSNSIPLTTIPDRTLSRFSSDFIAIGFDVIDLSGLSALANVGYIENDLTMLPSASIEINEYGLISTDVASRKYGEFASIAAPEHVPFFPVEIWAQKVQIASL